jgi:molybdate transport system ATP-binding protein
VSAGAAHGAGAALGASLSPWIELFQLGPLLGRPVIQLSNGERKRAQIAKALSGRPLLLILDDPFSGLDASGRAALTEALRGLCQDGTQLLFFLSRGETPDFVTHVAELRSGSLSPALPRSAFASEGEEPASAPPIPDRLRHLEGAASFITAVRLVDAVVRYGDKLALDRVSWEVKRGERWQLAGPNGAGKTTLLSLITADHPQAYANELYLFDRRRGSGETIWDIKSRIGFVSPELHAAFPRDASCEAVVASGLFDSIGLFEEPTAAQSERVSWWLEAIGEEANRASPIDELPLGRARMVLLARALVKDPPLLILDEPCQGLDERQAALFLALLDEICDRSATTMIFVSHVEEDIPRCVTRCLRLEAGRVAYLGKRQAPRA